MDKVCGKARIVQYVPGGQSLTLLLPTADEAKLNPFASSEDDSGDQKEGSDRVFSLSNAFHTLSKELKQQRFLIDFSLTQASLDTVFQQVVNQAHKKADTTGRRNANPQSQAPVQAEGSTQVAVASPRRGQLQ